MVFYYFDKLFKEGDELETVKPGYDPGHGFLAGACLNSRT